MSGQNSVSEALSPKEIGASAPSAGTVFVLFTLWMLVSTSVTLIIERGDSATGRYFLSWYIAIAGIAIFAVMAMRNATGSAFFKCAGALVATSVAFNLRPIEQFFELPPLVVGITDFTASWVAVFIVVMYVDHRRHKPENSSGGIFALTGKFWYVLFLLPELAKLVPLPFAEPVRDSSAFALTMRIRLIGTAIIGAIILLTALVSALRKAPDFDWPKDFELPPFVSTKGSNIILSRLSYGADCIAIFLTYFAKGAWSIVRWCVSMSGNFFLGALEKIAIFLLPPRAYLEIAESLTFILLAALGPTMVAKAVLTTESYLLAPFFADFGLSMWALVAGLLLTAFVGALHSRGFLTKGSAELDERDGTRVLVGGFSVLGLVAAGLACAAIDGVLPSSSMRPNDVRRFPGDFTFFAGFILLASTLIKVILRRFKPVGNPEPVGEPEPHGDAGLFSSRTSGEKKGTRPIDEITASEVAALAKLHENDSDRTIYKAFMREIYSRQLPSVDAIPDLSSEEICIVLDILPKEHKSADGVAYLHEIIAAANRKKTSLELELQEIRAEEAREAEDSVLVRA